jgi:3-deoxy-7-phosphoheptulonate synthase
MDAKSTEQQIEYVMRRLVDLGFKTHLSQGTERIVIGAIGDRRSISLESLSCLPGVLDVVPIRRPFKMVSREMKPEPTLIKLPNTTVGVDIQVIAGPCSVESREQILTVARRVKAAGATMLRGGAYKPRTSPYAFQGLGEEALKYLAEAREETGLPIVTEVMDTEQLDTVAAYADVLQIGARNMQNFSLLRKVGRTQKPILLKRGPAATIEEFLMSAEYILSEGNQQVILCERGIRTIENDFTRNTLDISAIPVIKNLSHLPIIVDPSHGTGRAYLISPMSKAALAAGSDGIMVEVHPKPEEALSDGPQSLDLEAFDALMKTLGVRQ